MYKDTKIIRYTLRDNIKNQTNAEKDFDIIDGFKGLIEKYIFTDIQMTDDSEPIEKAFQSRLQILMSSVLLRTLLLKEGLVVALNENNFPSYYAILKSLLEVPAMLGYIADLINHSNDYQKIIPIINKLYLGNREAGGYTVGSVDQINILTMFEKLDELMKEIEASRDEYSEDKKKEIKESEDILTSSYKDVCNFGHINHNAHLSIGILGKDGVWRAKRDVSGYKEELYAFYMPSFIATLELIDLISGIIAKNKKVSDFNLLSNPLYFA